MFAFAFCSLVLEFFGKVEGLFFSLPHFTPLADLYRLTEEMLGQGAYAKVQGCISLQNGNEYAVKVSVCLVKASCSCKYNTHLRFFVLGGGCLVENMINP